MKNLYNSKKYAYKKNCVHGQSSILQLAQFQKIKGAAGCSFVSEEESFSHHWPSTMGKKSSVLLYAVGRFQNKAK